MTKPQAFNILCGYLTSHARKSLKGQARRPTFEIITPENSTTISLYNKVTGHVEEWSVAKDSRAYSHAIFSFARQQGIKLIDVGYAIRV